ncbi:MAG TPA: DUF4350 domain-containing protein [Verrucomicrobiae bacterium]|jgi:hypothetical protein|nr:DUF4350 domain-containing protein [Verrucomicrobiae bacterium]
MPLALVKSDRRLLFWTGLIVLVIIVVLAWKAQSQDQDSGIPSSYSAQSHGAKAAFLLLQETGYNAERWERPPRDLAVDSGPAVLVLADPTDFPSPEERRDLERFVRSGGRILATGSFVSFFLPDAKTEREPLPSPEYLEFEPRNLTSLTRAGKIQMSPAAHWDSTAVKYLVHYSDGDRPVVVSYKVGRGEVIWWASSIPLNNAGIAKSGNLGLLLNSVGNPKDVHVLWDEYFHGYRRTLGSYMGEPPVLYGLVQCGIVLLALLFTHSRRNGPIRAWNEPTRLSPLEFVTTLGNLYRRAHAVQTALDVPYARFRSQTIRQLGLRADVSAGDLARSIRSRLGYKDPGLEKTLVAIEASKRGTELSEEQALELVQQLSRHAYNLKFIASEEQEIALHADSVPGTHARPD